MAEAGRSAAKREKAAGRLARIQERAGRLALRGSVKTPGANVSPARLTQLRNRVALAQQLAAARGVGGARGANK